MAGLGAESVTPIRPDLATNLQPLQLGVQQNAVALVADSFRQGQISANDIIERFSVLNKTKERVQIQGLEEFISPDAIAARQQHASLMSEKDKSELALLPVVEQAKRAEFESVRIKAAQGDKAAMREYSIKHGFGPNISQPTGGNYTSADSDNDMRVYQDAVKYDQAIKSAEGIVKDIKPLPNTRRFTGSDGSVEEDTDYNNPILSSESGKSTYTQDQSVRASNLARMTPQQWIAAGRPNADEYVLGIKPPAPAQQSSAGGKVTDLVTPRETTETTTKTRKPDGTETEVVVRKVVEPTQNPNSPASIADLAPGQVYKAPQTTDKKANESQTKAILAVPGVVSAETNMDTLKTMGWDNTTWGSAGWSIAAAVLPGVVEKPLETAGRKLFENAVSSFKEGMLRLSSGGAITEPEHVNYREMYFPMPRDPIQLVQSKEKLRAEMGVMVAKLATQNLHTPEKGSIEEKNIAAIHARARAQSGVGAAATSTQAGRPAMGGAGERKIIDLPGIGKGYYDATTKKFHPVQ